MLAVWPGSTPAADSPGLSHVTQFSLRLKSYESGSSRGERLCIPGGSGRFGLSDPSFSHKGFLLPDRGEIWRADEAGGERGCFCSERCVRFETSRFESCSICQVDMRSIAGPRVLSQAEFPNLDRMGERVLAALLEEVIPVAVLAANHRTRRFVRC